MAPALILMAFLAGFSLRRAGLCAYGAMAQWLRAGRNRAGRGAGFLTFAAAAAWATLALLPLAWWGASALPGAPPVVLAPAHTGLATAALAGMVLGLGAFINRGCFFGSFVALSGGRLAYLATFAGLALGASLARIPPLAAHLPAAGKAPPAASATLPALLWLLLAAGLAPALTRCLTRTRLPRLRARGREHTCGREDTCGWQGTGRWQGRHGPRGLLATGATVIAIGAAGGLLHALLPGWDLAALLTRSALHLTTAAAPPAPLTLLTAAAMIAGGLAASLSGGHWRPRRARAREVLTHLSGGGLMGLGAAFIPGGNDTLLLNGIPALAPQALAGLAGMLLALWLLLKARRQAGR